MCVCMCVCVCVFVYVYICVCMCVCVYVCVSGWVGVNFYSKYIFIFNYIYNISLHLIEVTRRINQC